MRAPSRPKAVTVGRERRVEDGRQHLEQGLLDHPVQHRRDAEPPYPASGLRDLYPPYRLRLVPAAQQLFPNAWPAFPAVRLQHFDGHPVYPWCTAVRHYPRMGRDQVLAAQHLLHELRSLVPGCSVLCRARLTLASRYLGGSAACLTGAIGPLSHTCRRLLRARTDRSGSARPVWPFAPVRRSYYGRG